MKALVGAFSQEKALVGAFSVIVQRVVEPMDGFTALVYTQLQSPVLAAWMTDAVCVGMGSNISNINVAISQSMQHIIFCILPPLHSLFSQTQARIAPGINDGPKHEYADTKDDM